ncbi:MAG: hypothetical protein UR31_C0015G0001 [Parcubacteria group bacterium GW2011_GWA2_33_14]|uniref:Uncharacterized protein n=1 Tax=Candidatus Staskawiczbacteria bacterium RIFCSPHIGHO2_02_FULL_33_16 TaxID=1802204 RepID=A0A1G2HX66_9BACT|nr:MAG: hypothetical protein UR31_C0015G0001 [Parcubacteria group bacterium GW2011_GWA2_33_14]OGZ67112.1 MAG: hypothetical protein A3D34_02440 [Candidatus Staskawiczbacteria bacterium RIFCSPHIGHO2_02_FULL_33_16]OGZ70958.1 MAG: hypothetical protein A2980_03050 [Candidatus Staskawiczbacteria bacterium RIFCSPLOWO2_01_FULL_33_13]
MSKGIGNEKVSMQTKIELYAPKTKKFNQYIFEKIDERMPLRTGKLIEIKITEGDTPFPEITEIPNDIAGEWGKPGDARNYEARQEMRLETLDNYMNHLLGVFCFQPYHRTLSLDPMSVIFSFTITHPEEMLGWAQEVGIDLRKFNGIKHNFENTEPNFLEEPPQIEWDRVIIPLEPESYQFYVCKSAFSRKKGKTIYWDKVKAKIDGNEENLKKEDWRIIYDAVRAVNRKVKEATKLNLFKVSKKTFYRLY